MSQALTFLQFNHVLGFDSNQVDDDVRLEDDWVPMDESLGPQQLEEVLRAKEAHSRAVVLESVRI